MVETFFKKACETNMNSKKQLEPFLDLGTSAPNKIF